MNVSECMSRDAKICSPDDTIQGAARAMRDIDAGILPVGENDRLIGMITDRDIAVRAVAEGRGPDCPVRDVMTSEIRYCFDDQDISEAAEHMSSQQVRRMPVLNRDKRLVGVISLGDLAKASGEVEHVALAGITRPGGQHVQ